MSFNIQRHGYPTAKFLDEIEEHCRLVAQNNSEASAILAIAPLVRAAIGPETGIEAPVSIKANGHKSGTWNHHGKDQGQALFFTLTIETLAPFDHKE